MDYEDSTVKVFSDNALDYSDRQAPWQFQERERKLFLSGIKPGGKILDLGCGPGNDAKRFADLGYEVLAVDGAPGMVDLARKKGLRGKVMKYSEIESLGEFFDGIWASYALLHIPKADMVGVLNKIKKVLNPGGIFYASFREGEGEDMRKDDRYKGGRYFAYYSKNELQGIFEQVFEKVELDYVENRDGEKGGVYALVLKS
ncbi:MAG: class I SAM-dependent methyltransferase [Desulfobacteraceae bacterium]|jgi:2-polyprenyl-3-methyl-5-hydroxy-6-metoxy-1,4-benzoquinol methylase